MTALVPVPVESVELTPLGLTFHAPLELDEWVNLGRKIAAYDNGMRWAIGDWLLYGAEAWPGTYMELAAEMGMSEQSIANSVSVAKRVPPLIRRDDLSWSHHEEVASLHAHRHVQIMWLEQAAASQWTREEFRGHLASVKADIRIADQGRPTAARPPVTAGGNSAEPSPSLPESVKPDAVVQPRRERAVPPSASRDSDADARRRVVWQLIVEGPDDEVADVAAALSAWVDAVTRKSIDVTVEVGW